MEGIGKDAEVAVEEEDDDEGEDGGGGGLHYCADLKGVGQKRAEISHNRSFFSICVPFPSTMYKGWVGKASGEGRTIRRVMADSR